MSFIHRNANFSASHATVLNGLVARQSSHVCGALFLWLILSSVVVLTSLAEAPVAQSPEAETCPESPSSPSFPPGLYTPHTKIFTPVPERARRTVCVCPQTELAVLRAFHSLDWQIIELEETDNGDPVYLDCESNGDAVVIWTKPQRANWWVGKPWQRANWLPAQNLITHKGHFQRALLEYEAHTGEKLPFIPDTYLLPEDRELLLQRLRPESRDNANSAGLNEPWVIKLSATDNGVGIGIYGPNSWGVQHLYKTLVENSNPDDYMHPLRESLVLAEQEDDLRDPTAIQRARARSLGQNDDIVVQRYICHEMDYKGRKFDLRLYFLVASVDPLVVYYHDGALRVSLSEYNDKVFTSTTNHLTNLGRNDAMDNCTISLPDWEVDLKAHIAASQSRFPPSVVADPLNHIRNQAKAAFAHLVAATRKTAYGGIRGELTFMENLFALLGGDFIVDADLHVWMTEAQSSPGFGHETKVRLALYSQFIPSAIAIVEEVMEKQVAGLPLFPMKNTGNYELIYTDDYQFRYDFQHKKQQHGPC